MTSHNGSTATPPRSSSTPSFLTSLPPELRLEIYTHLLTTPSPIHGRTARGTTKYNIHTAILRTCRQIHFEARHVFFGRNTFAITPVMPSTNYCSFMQEKRKESGERQVVFDPPLRVEDMGLIRHLSIDILYYPKQLITCNGTGMQDWFPISPGASSYISALSTILAATQHNLRSLKIVADTRRVVQAQHDAYAYMIDGVGYCIDPWPMEGEGEVDVDYKKYITGFYFADKDAAFAAAIAGLKNVKDVEVRFEFEEISLGFVAGKERVVGGRLVGLADKVFRARRGILDLEGCGGEGGGEGDGDRCGREGEGGEGDRTGVVVLDW